MKRVNNILDNKEYRKRILEIEELELSREFCGHGFEHLLMVARLGYAILLEDMNYGKETIADTYGLDEAKELIYASALLHDIGRYSTLEIDMGMNHRESGIYIASPIIRQAGFDRQEEELILGAIKNHGTMSENPGSLEGIIFRADKKSRNCFSCKAYDTCNWPKNQKNNNIDI
ncbi:MAG: HD domain-containing protein [Eubacterium sp.]|nr:HD domain-containing protein [Eubacterium sp.]